MTGGSSSRGDPKDAALQGRTAEHYDAQEEGTVSIDVLRERLNDEPKLVEIVSNLHAEGLYKAPPQEWFLQVMEAYLRDRLDAEIVTVPGSNTMREVSIPSPTVAPSTLYAKPV